MVERGTVTDSFSAFVRETGPGLKHALMAALGPETGTEAAAEALTYGWEHWERVETMDNPGGYLFRVGRNWGKRRLSKWLFRPLFQPVSAEMPWIEPALPGALAALSERQRTVVVMVYAADWSFAQVAALLGISRGAVDKHAKRGLASLRDSLEVDYED